MYQRLLFEEFVSKPTRGRGSSQPTLIDLVLTNNPDIIDKVDHDDPLGKSDHSVVEIIMQNVLRKGNKGKQRELSGNNQDFVKKLRIVKMSVISTICC